MYIIWGRTCRTRHQPLTRFESWPYVIVKMWLNLLKVKLHILLHRRHQTKPHLFPPPSHRPLALSVGIRSRGTDGGPLCSSKAKMSATVKGWSYSKGRSDSRGRRKWGAGTSHSLLPDRYNGSNFFSTLCSPWTLFGRTTYVLRMIWAVSRLAELIFYSWPKYVSA